MSNVYPSTSLCPILKPEHLLHWNSRVYHVSPCVSWLKFIYDEFLNHHLSCWSSYFPMMNRLGKSKLTSLDIPIPKFNVQLYPTVKTHFFISFSTVKAAFLGPSTVATAPAAPSPASAAASAPPLRCWRHGAKADARSCRRGPGDRLSADTDDGWPSVEERVTQLYVGGPPLNNHCNPILFARSSGWSWNLGRFLQSLHGLYFLHTSKNGPSPAGMSIVLYTSR